MIRIVLPFHLRTLAKIDGEVRFERATAGTLAEVLNALEENYPALRGTIRNHVTLTRRPFIRFFACQRDLSHDPPDAPLPPAVLEGVEPLLIVGAMAGG